MQRKRAVAGTQAECVRALKGLALPRASHSSEIALADSRRLRSTLAAVSVLFAHAIVTVAKNRTFATPNWRSRNSKTVAQYAMPRTAQRCHQI